MEVSAALQEENTDMCDAIMQISELLYQNLEQEGYSSFSENSDKIREAIMKAWGEKYHYSPQAKEMLLYLIQNMLEAFNRKDILALADLLRYEVMEYIR